MHMLSEMKFIHGGIILNGVYYYISMIYHNWLATIKRYTNTDLKICPNLHLRMEIMFWRFHIKTLFTSWDMCTWDVWKFCLQTFRDNRIRWKLVYFIRINKLHGQITREFVELRMRNFQGIVFIWNKHIGRFSNLH